MSILETLRSEVETRIAALTSTDTAEDMLALVSSLDVLTEDRMNTLDLINDLPEAYTVPEGTIFYVNEINTLVYASAQNKWKGLDGRVLREDPIAALAWGNNSSGIIGDGTTINRSSPNTVIGGVISWSSVSAGKSAFPHNLGIAGGIAYAWGNGANGKIGNGSTIAISSPVTVVGGITNWTQVSAGRDHSLGIRDGLIYAWGFNQNGRTTLSIATSSPTLIVGSITNWKQVSAGFYHNLAIRDGGDLYAWGSNSSGQVGDGSNVIRSSPVTVVGGITNWSQVSAGLHSLGIANGVAYAWGLGTSGQLGNGTNINSSSPVTVGGGITNWSQVSAGLFHSLGIANGIAYGWGVASHGRLGSGNTTNTNSPVTVVGGITNWAHISASADSHSLGLTLDGTLYSWGNNIRGQLGDDSTINRSSPVTVIGGISSWNQISTGTEHSIAIKTD